MKLCGREVKPYVFISTFTFLCTLLSLGLKGFSNHNYWELKVPQEIQPYVERGIVKKVYVLSPNLYKYKVKSFSALVFLIGWFPIIIYLLILVITSLSTNTKERIDLHKGSNNNKIDTKLNLNDPQHKSILELKTFFLSYPIVLIICNNTTPILLPSLVHFYINIIKSLGFSISYGEINKLESNISISNMYNYIGEDVDRIKDKISSICVEVTAFKQEREQRTKKGSTKLALIINNVNKLLLLSKQQSIGDALNDLEILTTMGLKDVDMKLMLIYDINEAAIESHIEQLGGNEVGILEFKTDSKTHVTLKTSNKGDKTIALPTKESLSKYLNT